MRNTHAKLLTTSRLKTKGKSNFKIVSIEDEEEVLPPILKNWDKREGDGLGAIREGFVLTFGKVISALGRRQALIMTVRSRTNSPE